MLCLQKDLPVVKILLQLFYVTVTLRTNENGPFTNEDEYE